MCVHVCVHVHVRACMCVCVCVRVLQVIYIHYIVMSFEKRNASNYESITFPLQDTLKKQNETAIDIMNNSIHIPGTLIQQRAKLYGTSVGSVNHSYVYT